MTVMDEVDVADPRSLISDELFERLTRQIAQKDHTTHDDAASMLVDALAFLKKCADHPGANFVPSPRADVAWHRFMLDTRAYAAFCEQAAGRFIHHAPDDEGSCAGGGDRCSMGCKSAG